MEILTCGLLDSQNEYINQSVQRYDISIRSTDFYTDYIAIPSILMMINTCKMDNSEIEEILDFYYEVEKFNEIIILIGEINVKEGFRSNIFVYSSFEELKEKISYHILSAVRSERKTKQFSTILANCLQILKMMKNREKVTTKEMSENLEVTPRTVQRYIQTLCVAGEWIEYDNHTKSWYLIEGKSILLDEI